MKAKGYLLFEWVAMVCVLLGSIGRASTITTETSLHPGDVAEPWHLQAVVYESELDAGLLIHDDSFSPTQMLAPQRPLGLQQTARPQRTQETNTRQSGLASVPFMIGDTGAGSCISYGSFLEVDLAHPTLACGRLNLAEANTPLPVDRLYYSYRHFANATPTRVFQYREDFDVERHTLAGERTFFDKMMSVEIRMPLEYRLNSQTGTYSVNPFDQRMLGFAPGFDPIYGAGGEDRRVEFGNVSMIFKALLHERPGFALSAGLGVSLPTARDVTYDAVIDDYITFPESPFLARYALQISSIASNETVYLSPYLAWVSQPTSRFFHQGFLQIETPANPSFFTVGGFGEAVYDSNGNNLVSINAPELTDTYYQFVTSTTGLPISVAKLQPQTLMRLNLGWGYILAENAQADWIQRLTGLFEVHWTSTLNDATINEAPLTVAAFPFDLVGRDAITVGNKNNRVDIINVTTGVTANMGAWVMTHGVTAPLKRCECSRGFDFEYNLQIQRPF